MILHHDTMVYDTDTANADTLNTVILLGVSKPREHFDLTWHFSMCSNQSKATWNHKLINLRFSFLSPIFYLKRNNTPLIFQTAIQDNYQQKVAASDIDLFILTRQIVARNTPQFRDLDSSVPRHISAIMPRATHEMKQEIKTHFKLEYKQTNKKIFSPLKRCNLRTSSVL